MHLRNLPMDIQGAIFDMDGTLLDSMTYWEDLGEQYLISRNKQPEPDIRTVFKQQTVEASALYMKDTYDLEESPKDIVQGILNGISSHYYHDIPLKPGVRNLLDAMRDGGVKMCVATASPRAETEAAFKRLGISEYFGAVFTCSEVGKSKSSPDIFEEAVAYLGTPREHTLVLEDSLHAMLTAHEAGFPVVAIEEPSASEDLPRILQVADAYWTLPLSAE